MAFKAKLSTTAKQRAPSASAFTAKPNVVLDTNLLLTWFKDFDLRLADLTTRQNALLKSLGVEPAPHRESTEHQPTA
jgi:hypothetical protein